MTPDTIARLINQHSYLVMAAGLWLAVAMLLLRRRPPGGPRVAPGSLAALALIGAALFGIWLSLRQGKGSVTETAQVEALLGSGRPVLVEFYSDY